MLDRDRSICRQFDACTYGGQDTGRTADRINSCISLRVIDSPPGRATASHVEDDRAQPESIGGPARILRSFK